MSNVTLPLLENAVDNGYLTWKQVAIGLMDILGNETLYESMLAHWGKRCPDYEKDCPACDAWRKYDAFIRKAHNLREDLL